MTGNRSRDDEQRAKLAELQQMSHHRDDEQRAKLAELLRPVRRSGAA